MSEGYAALRRFVPQCLENIVVVDSNPVPLAGRRLIGRSWRCGWWRGSLKLNAAALANGDLLNGFHFAPEPGEFCGLLVITADEEQRRPKYDYADCCDDRIPRCLFILSARDDGCTMAQALCLLRELWTRKLLVLVRRHVTRRDPVSALCASSRRYYL